LYDASRRHVPLADVTCGERHESVAREPNARAVRRA
jgi:hypothetical protein